MRVKADEKAEGKDRSYRYILCGFRGGTLCGGNRFLHAEKETRLVMFLQLQVSFRDLHV